MSNDIQESHLSAFRRSFMESGQGCLSEDFVCARSITEVGW